MFGYKCFLRLVSLSHASEASLLSEGYELLSCNYSFSQGTDQNGKAQSDVTGGIIRMIYPNLPSKELTDWMKTSNKLLSGALVLLDAEGIPAEKVMFEDAACVGMEINFTEEGASYAATSLTLSVRKLTLGAIEKSFRWVNMGQNA